MLYIHQSYCISPQQTFQQVNIEELNDVQDKKLLAIEPGYEGIPPGILRRMGKAIRIGVGAALPIIKTAGKLDGIIIGTAKGGMEDCIKFLNQIIQYEEGVLAPGNFVQSTSNAIAAQLGLLSHNTCYNITHVHRGLAFENAVIDAMMQLNDFPGNQYLLGAVDEISSYNYNIETLAGSYKTEDISNKQLYETNSPGTIAGEGAAAFLVNDKKEDAIAELVAIKTFHTTDEKLIREQLELFIKNHAGNETIDMFLSGEDGDSRISGFYTGCETLFPATTSVARFKHMCGEYATATGWALWLACYVLGSGQLPAHMIKKPGASSTIKTILIYNNYKGRQHSFMLIRK